MTCAILIPSLGRPQRLRQTIANIHEVTPEDHKILFCVSDSASKGILDELGEWYLDDSADPDQRYVTRMNKLVRSAEGGADTFFFGSDDVVHHPHWLERALGVMQEAEVRLVVLNDLHNPNGTQALMRSDYLPLAVFDSPGDAFHHGYHHNFADNEQHYTAWRRGEYARSLHAIVEHLHPVFGSSNALPWDPTYSGAQVGWDRDSLLFQNRMQLIDHAVPMEVAV